MFSKAMILFVLLCLNTKWSTCSPCQPYYGVGIKDSSIRKTFNNQSFFLKYCSPQNKSFFSTDHILVTFRKYNRLGWCVCRFGFGLPRTEVIYIPSDMEFLARPVRDPVSCRFGGQLATTSSTFLIEGVLG